jgi:hypothetical protein
MAWDGIFDMARWQDGKWQGMKMRRGEAAHCITVLLMAAWQEARIAGSPRPSLSPGRVEDSKSIFIFLMQLQFYESVS